MYVCKYACMYVCTYVYMYVYTYVCIRAGGRVDLGRPKSTRPSYFWSGRPFSEKSTKSEINT